MSKVSELQEFIELPDEIRDACASGKLVCFVGAGASIQHGLPTWHSFAQKVLEDLQDNELLNYSEIEQLGVLDAKKRLSLATVIARKKKLKLDFRKYFELKDRHISSLTRRHDNYPDTGGPLKKTRILAEGEYVYALSCLN